MFCTSCGSQNLDGAKFCSKCGKPLKAPIIKEPMFTESIVPPSPSPVTPPAVSPTPAPVTPPPVTPTPVVPPVMPAQTPQTPPQKDPKSQELDDYLKKIQMDPNLHPVHPQTVSKKTGLLSVIIASILVFASISVAGVYGFMEVSKLPKNNLALELAQLESTDSIMEILNSKFEEIQKLVDDETYGKAAIELANFETVVNDTYSKYQYTPDEPKGIGEALTELKEDVADFKANQYEVLVKGAYADEDLDSAYALFELTLVTDANKDELIPIMAEVFAYKGEVNRVNQMLKMLMTPYSLDAVQRVSDIQVQIDSKYPIHSSIWNEVSIAKYDIVESFKDGLAKVGMFSGTDATGTPVYKWGLINTDGTEVVTPKYDSIGEYLENRAAVKLNGKWGFIDKEGKEVIAPVYDDIKDPIDAAFFAYAKRDPEKIYKGFYEGYAPVQQNGNWGFIDVNGNPLSPGIIFKEVLIFSEGSAVVRLGDKYGLLGSDGRYIHEPNTSNPNGINFDIVRPIFEGLAGVNWDDRKSRGLINTSGYLVAQFDKEYIDLVQDFREGLASVRKIDSSGKAKWGFINTSGNIVIPISFDSVTVFIDGVSKVEQNGKFGLMNRNGNIITPVVYDAIGFFENGYAIVTQSGMQGIVDMNGQIVVTPQYEAINGYVNGVTGFKSNGKWGLLDESGNVVVTPLFEDMKTFNHGVAPVKLNGKWGYIDITGFFVISPQFDDANAFVDGLAVINKAGTFSYISLVNVPSNLVGQIVDETNVPLANAPIHVYEVGFEDPISTIYTNPNGEFKTVLPSGSYFVKVAQDDYMPVESYFDLSSGYDTFTSKIVTVANESSEKANARFTVQNALNGEGLGGVEVKFRKGYNNKSGDYLALDCVEISEVSDESGLVEIELPVGAYTAETYLDGYTPTYINITSSTRIDYSAMEIRSMPVTEELADGETRITLEWGTTPSDLDAHLIGPVQDSSTRFHIFYPVKGNLIHDAMLDKDDTSGNGFETTTIYSQHEGRYVFSVFDFSNQYDYNSYAMSLSGARVRVYQGSLCVATFDIPANKKGILWEVFAIEGNQIIPINNVTNHLDAQYYTY